jgi:phosphoribosylformylglycinamidine cyclo-ligase
MVTYKDAGVDIAEGDRLVDRIRPLVAETAVAEQIGGVGGFAGLVKVPDDMREPVLVSGTDGVGTKLMVAHAAGRHDTVGVDLVAMCVNDVLTVGARPLFFLDYLACGRLDVEQAEEVIAGMVRGCRAAGCALIGGETAEMPGMYPPGTYDLAGFAVGVVERSRIIDGRNVRAGDVLLGLPSSGLHANGFSLARKVLLDDPGCRLEDVPPGLDRPLADVLLEPTRIYASEVAVLQHTARVKAMVHVTGGGLPGNVARVLPEGTAARIDTGSWDRPPVFGLIESAGVDAREMAWTFNLGIGMVIIVDGADAEACLEALAGGGTRGVEIGEVIARTGDAPVVGL